MNGSTKIGDEIVLERSQLDALIKSLNAKGYRTLGPTIDNQAMVYDEIDGIGDLPQGLTDRQDGGRYQLVPRDDKALFGYVVGQHTWKEFLHPSCTTLWNAKAEGQRFLVLPVVNENKPMAFVGVRPCELAAIRIQDRVLMEGPYPDSEYQKNREQTVIVVVNCNEAGGCCFCASMGTGPHVEGKQNGYDLALTEILTGKHRFHVKVGSQKGADLVDSLGGAEATPSDKNAVERLKAEAKGTMGRKMNTEGVKDLLYRNASHPQWEDVATRCLMCGNCTMVCPTCFCVNITDETNLAGTEAERVRRWDSCFTLDFSYIHGGSVRFSPEARYRHWMTHKVASWQEQFGSLGCVGCGRCITWCPVGIDITEELRSIQATAGGVKEGGQ